MRYAVDRQFVDWTEGLSRIEHPTRDELFRPADIDQWRAALPPTRDFPERFETLLDLLERNPDAWIYISW